MPAINAIMLFVTKAVKESSASMSSDLLDVTMDANDSLPQHICEKCKRSVETLERSAEDLMWFEILTRDSYRTLSRRLK